MAEEKSSSSKKLAISIAVLIILIISLCVSTVALVIAMLEVENNLFSTGYVAINLNDGKAVVEEYEFVFEPGATVEKDFFIENTGTCSVYYKLYLANVAGELADVLVVTIRDGDRILYEGTANELNREDVLAADDELALGERKTLTISFYFPPNVGNDMQNQYMSFDLSADAVQTKNNPYKLFD